VVAVLAILAAVSAVVVALIGGIKRLLAGSRTIAGVVVRTPTDETRIDPDGAVRSIQSADIVMPVDMLRDLWTPEMLERLARTYWSFLSRATLGLMRVYYTDTERYVCLLHPKLRLLTFRAPEYELEATRGIVRWRIERGLLVAPRGRAGDGYLEIDVRLLPCDLPGKARVNVEVEVANFYPMIASRLGRFLYTQTQSRIHVVVTHGFLRRLARRNLDRSVTGRFRVPAPEEARAPRRAHERV
jgi:hypothetical protein